MYSEQGLLALIGPSAGQVCQSLMVVSNCRPGSAQAQAARLTLCQRARALTVLCTLPSVRRSRYQSPSCSRARMNPSGTRTELLAFMPPTVT